MEGTDFLDTRKTENPDDVDIFTDAEWKELRSLGDLADYLDDHLLSKMSASE